MFTEVPFSLSDPLEVWDCCVRSPPSSGTMTGIVVEVVLVLSQGLSLDSFVPLFTGWSAAGLSLMSLRIPSLLFISSVDSPSLTVLKMSM